jgi:hypothetical protein
MKEKNKLTSTPPYPLNNKRNLKKKSTHIPSPFNNEKIN